MTDGPTAFPTDQLLDALEVAIVVFDVEGHILLANQRAQGDMAVLGRPIGGDQTLYEHGLDLIDEHGRPLSLARHPLGAHTAHRGDAQRLRDGRALARIPGHGVDHRRHPAAARRRRRRSPASSARFFDTTTERRAQTALRASEERFRLIAENAADVVYRFTVGEIAALRLREPGGRGRARLHAAGVLRRPVADREGHPRRRRRRRALARLRRCRRRAFDAAPHGAARRHADLDRAQGRAAAELVG